MSKDRNAQEEKCLSLPPEKIVSTSIDDKTWVSVQTLGTSDPKLYINRIEKLTFLLLEFPEEKGMAAKERIIPYFLLETN